MQYSMTGFVAGFAPLVNESIYDLPVHAIF